MYRLQNAKLSFFLLIAGRKARSAESVDLRVRSARALHSPFSHSLQTIRLKTARIRLTDQRKKYDCLAVYSLYRKKMITRLKICEKMIGVYVYLLTPIKLDTFVYL